MSEPQRDLWGSESVPPAGRDERPAAQLPETQPPAAPVRRASRPSAGLPAPSRPVLKDTHAVVFRGLRIANIASGRVVPTADVVAALTADERSDLLREYARDDVRQIVAKILDQLYTRGIVVSPGRVGAQRYYGVPDVLTKPHAMQLPSNQSRRQRVLLLIRAAVETTGAPVRAGDVVTFAAGRPEARDLTRTLIIRDIHNLVRTGDLRVTGEVRGGGVDGSCLYLPADLDPAAYAAHPAPQTWLEAVADAVDGCWRDEMAAAAREERRPRPLTTGAVRARLAAMYVGAAARAVDADGPPPGTPDHVVRLVVENLQEPIMLVGAMQSLAGSATPYLRRVDRGTPQGPKSTYTNLWVPFDVPDEALDVGSAFANDSERVAEAVRRACQARGVPAVQRRVIEEEIALDPALRLIGTQTVARYLSDAAKSKVDCGDGTRRARVAPSVRQVGRVGGEAYYAATPTAADSPSDAASDAVSAAASDASVGGNVAGGDVARSGIAAAEAYVAVLQLQVDWRDLAIERRLRRISEATIPTLIAGRAMLLRDQAVAVLTELAAFDNDPVAARGAVAAGAPALRDSAARAVEEAETTVRLVRAGSRQIGPEVAPLAVDATVPGWTAAELLPLFRPIYPRAERIEDPIELVRLLGKAIRRVPNPEFTWRKESAEFLFDRTDALLYAAKQWGGAECQLMAGLVEPELERLRDVRLVLPALAHRDFSIRMSAVACLAFLWSDDARSALRHTALTDSEPGVRRAALWGYGFAGGDDVGALAAEILETDASALVCALAEQASTGDVDWWRL